MIGKGDNGGTLEDLGSYERTANWRTAALPHADPDERAREVLRVSDNLVQDLQGLLLRLHTSSDELRALLERIEGVVGEAHQRIEIMVAEIKERSPDSK
jgi:hypothetical protein